MFENAGKMYFTVEVSTKHTHFYGHHWIPHIQNYGYRHQDRDSSCSKTQVMAQYVISHISTFKQVVHPIDIEKIYGPSNIFYGIHFLCWGGLRNKTNRLS